MNNLDARYKLILKSKNSKLSSDGIPAMYSEKSTCPKYCAFYNKCYAKAGNVSYTFNRFDKDQLYGGSWDQFIEAVTNNLRYTKLRLNVSGDLPNTNDQLDLDAMVKLSLVVKRNKIKTWGYTHRRNSNNTIKKINNNWLCINRSFHTLVHASKAHKEGVPSVVCLPKKKIKKNGFSYNGVKFEICPNQINKSVKCDTCMICADKNRDKVIVFIEH